jgi:hypothetical protein
LGVDYSLFPLTSGRVFHLTLPKELVNMFVLWIKVSCHNITFFFNESNGLLLQELLELVIYDNT